MIKVTTNSGDKEIRTLITEVSVQGVEAIQTSFIMNGDAWIFGHAIDPEGDFDVWVNIYDSVAYKGAALRRALRKASE